jgi:regulatory protein
VTPTTPISLEGRALRLLARREYARAELERRLTPHAEDAAEASAAEQIRAALDDLAARGWLNDARAAESVLASQGPRAGRRRLEQLLRSKGLDADLVESTLRQAAATELERARGLLQRRFGQPPASATERSRQVRFLAGRGFETDVIRRVVGGDADDD